MSAPTPVTVRAMTIDSGSARNCAATLNAPTATQSNTLTWVRRTAVGWEIRSTIPTMATTKAPATSEEANQPALSPRQRLPVSRRMAAPARGSAGIRGASFIAVSSPQEPGIVHVRASGLAVEGHDDGQSDHDFCRRHHHREEGQDLAGQIPMLSGEGDQGQIHRVQLQLDGHEDDQGIAPYQDPNGPYGEQQCGDQEEVGDRRPHRPCTAPSWAGC